MAIVNEYVVHESFGKGNVIGYDDSYIEVRFSSGTKRFAFPDALGVFITPIDPKIAQKAATMKERIQEEQRLEELELEKQRAIAEAKRQRRLERERLIRNFKLSPVSQVVFWCDKDELDTVFSDWKVFTGVRKSGVRAGMPNRLVRIHHNSCCLITMREPDVPEEERRIMGLFMAEETFVGRLCEDGFIPAHPQYRLRLSTEESKELLFWNYYLNQRYPHRIVWNSGRSRYFKNVWMAQILQKIVKLKQGTKDQALAENMLQYFCEMNRLAESQLPKPSGALLRINLNDK